MNSKDAAMTTTPHSTVREHFHAARTAGLRAKEAAESRGFSEGQAVAAHVGSHDFAPKATPLRSHWIELLQALEPCGPLMALTRNESTVHEKTGVYQKITGSGAMGLALGHDIDLRLFLNHWHAGFAVTELSANPTQRTQHSLQFFNMHGLAVHKIFPREATDLDHWQAAAAAFAVHDEQAGVFLPLRPRTCVLPQYPDEAVDAASLCDDWSSLKDTHEFFGMLKKHSVERQQSFRLAEGRFTERLASHAALDLLQEAAFEHLPLMCFVSNPGCIQIHSGPVQRIEPMNIRGAAWVNVIDPQFNLHLREDHIQTAWAVSKPTADGMVTSVELFDHQGELMTQFFGVRKPGQAEDPQWRDLVAHLVRDEKNTCAGARPNALSAA
jgi:putative hemin transport protein